VIVKPNLKRLPAVTAREPESATTCAARRDARATLDCERQLLDQNEFIAAVSHELRTPLTSIIATLGFLAGEGAGALPDQAARMLKIALANSRRLVGIVNDILDVEAVRSGKMPFKRAPVELRALLDEAVQANQAMAAQHTVSLRLDDTSAACWVSTDPDRLTQVIDNLVSNAIKFSPRNAEVVLSAGRAGDRARIKVRDHGPGIPPDYRERIFDRFVQVDATDRRRRGGTGLGLSIAREIVTLLGGTIDFESAPGRGTIFKVEIPALNDPAEEEGENDLHDAASARMSA
jgi:signal transduction histidine kinase